MHDFPSCQNDFVAVSNSQLGEGEANFFLQEPVQNTAPVMMVGNVHAP